jgi:N,N'-diacetylchitobiose phosphorylase
MNTKTLSSNTYELARHDRSSLEQIPGPLQLLTNGHLTSAFTARGTGFVHLGPMAVTRWRPDLSGEALGYFFYLRDLESGENWSLGYQPSCREPNQYSFSLTPGRATIERRDGEISSQIEVCIHPELDVELRRCTFTNHGLLTRSIEITSYAELVLQSSAGDNSHPAFSKLFVETWRNEAGVLFARRRPRGNNEQGLAACHFLAHGGEGVGDLEFETDRNRFIGRGRSLRDPAALSLSDSLNGTLGSVLDPIFSLRTVVILPPTASVTVVFGLSASYESEQLERVAEMFTNIEACDEVFEQADSIVANRLQQERVETSDVLETLRCTAREIYGIKSEPAKAASNGFSKNGEAARNSVGATVAGEGLRLSSPALDTSEELQHFNGVGGFSPDGREYVIRLEPNSQGELKLPPVPWNNIICNESVGFIASETGAGNTWASNSRLNRLTPWQNDPVLDPHSEAIYFRDAESGEFWSVTPGPVSSGASYEVRHGLGYSTYRHSRGGLEQTVTLFVPTKDPVKVSHVSITNTGTKTRRLNAYGYVQWELGEANNFSNLATQTKVDQSRNAILATNRERAEFSNDVAFMAAVGGIAHCSFTADRSEFLGSNGSLASPAAVAMGHSFSGHCGSDLDPCAAFQGEIVVEPGQTIEFAMLLGEAGTSGEVTRLLEKYQSQKEIAAALVEAQAFWRDLTSAVQIKTPSSAIDLMANGWLAYQNISCRMWGRSAAQQSGGAYGFRDQLQDSSALVFHRPDITRAQILRNAAHQYVEGDVMHWWHPPLSKGIRTHFADDLLWMPLVACEYVESTGDQSLWSEHARYITSEPVPPGEAEIYLTPSDSGQTGTVYEHCCRALDRGLTRGSNGLPLMGTGDWNDGMNRVGQGGTGESVWLAFFIDYILERMLKVCQQHDDHERFERYSAYREQLRIAIEENGWDGAWYRRAYFDDGTPLGTAAADECQIDALVQAWAVISGAADPERAEKAVAAADERLVDETAGIIRLLYPPFDKMANDPGYIKGYLPGVRENGGQYTHGVLWLIRAMAELGQGSRACELLEMISPVTHGNSPQVVATYKNEPYVVAADVYGHPPHVGRAGWSWYTGSAGWMFRVAFESILGIHLVNGEELRIDPSIASDWPECTINYRVHGSPTTYEITIRNPQGKQRGVRTATLDGKEVKVDAFGAHVPLVRDGKTHRAVVEL